MTKQELKEIIEKIMEKTQEVEAACIFGDCEDCNDCITDQIIYIMPPPE